MLYARGMGLAKDVAYPLSPNLFKQQGHIWEKQGRSYEKKGPEWNNAAYEKENFHTSSTGHHQFPSPFQPKRKIRDVRKKEDPQTKEKKEESYKKAN